MFCDEKASMYHRKQIAIFREREKQKKRKYQKMLVTFAQYALIDSTFNHKTQLMQRYIQCKIQKTNLWLNKWHVNSFQTIRCNTHECE